MRRGVRIGKQGVAHAVAHGQAPACSGGGAVCAAQRGSGPRGGGPPFQQHASNGPPPPPPPPCLDVGVAAGGDAHRLAQRLNDGHVVCDLHDNAWVEHSDQSRCGAGTPRLAQRHTRRQPAAAQSSLPDARAHVSSSQALLQPGSEPGSETSQSTRCRQHPSGCESSLLLTGPPPPAARRRRPLAHPPLAPRVPPAQSLPAAAPAG